MKYRSIDAMIEIQASHGIYEKAYKNAYQKKKKVIAVIAFTSN